MALTAAVLAIAIAIVIPLFGAAEDSVSGVIAGVQDALPTLPEPPEFTQN